MTLSPASLTWSHFATDRYRRVAPSLDNSYNPKSVILEQSDTLSSRRPEQKDGTNFNPSSGN